MTDPFRARNATRAQRHLEIAKRRAQWLFDTQTDHPWWELSERGSRLSELKRSEEVNRSINSGTEDYAEE